MASMYAVYHGPEGLRAIARRVHRLTGTLAKGLQRLGFVVGDATFFDTVSVAVSTEHAEAIHAAAAAKRINLRHLSPTLIGVSLDETVDLVDLVDLQDLWSVFNTGQPPGFDPASFAAELAHEDYPAPFARESTFLAHPVFNRFHTETEMLRYLKRLENKDLSEAAA